MDARSGVFIGILVVLIFAIIALSGGLAYWSMQNGSRNHHRYPECPTCPKCPATCAPEDCHDQEYCDGTCQACRCDWTLADNCDPTTGDCFCGEEVSCNDGEKCVDGACQSATAECQEDSDCTDTFSFCDTGTCSACACDETLADGCNETADNCTCGGSAPCTEGQQCVGGACQ